MNEYPVLHVAAPHRFLFQFAVTTNMAAYTQSSRSIIMTPTSHRSIRLRVLLRLNTILQTLKYVLAEQFVSYHFEYEIK